MCQPESHWSRLGSRGHPVSSHGSIRTRLLTKYWASLSISTLAPRLKEKLKRCFTFTVDMAGVREEKLSHARSFPACPEAHLLTSDGQSKPKDSAQGQGKTNCPPTTKASHRAVPNISRTGKCSLLVRGEGAEQVC